jgi:hypothetical protein
MVLLPIWAQLWQLMGLLQIVELVAQYLHVQDIAS